MKNDGARSQLSLGCARFFTSVTRVETESLKDNRKACLPHVMVSITVLYGENTDAEALLTTVTLIPPCTLNAYNYIWLCNYYLPFSCSFTTPHPSTSTADFQINVAAGRDTHGCQRYQSVVAG